MIFKNKTSFLVALFLLISFTRLQSNQSITVENDSLIQKAIEFSIQHDYELAEEIFLKIINKYPEHPIGYFFMAATIQSKMIDFETEKWDDKFFYYINLTIEKADSMITGRAKTDSWVKFYKGSALSYLAFFEGRREKYLPAIGHAISGISLLKKITKINPLFYDAYFGIGSYNYWVSRITRFVNWLPLIPDKRESGIQMVKQAVEKGKFTQYAAMNELIWILLDAGNSEQALYYAQAGLKNFPDSRFFLWGAAKSSFAAKNFKTSIEYFQQLLESITNAIPNNHYNEYICRVKLIECFLETNNKQQAKNQIDCLKFLILSPEIKKRLKKQRKRFEQFEKILDP